jgi:hypothetical protein
LEEADIFTFKKFDQLIFNGLRIVLSVEFVNLQIFFLWVVFPFIPLILGFSVNLVEVSRGRMGIPLVVVWVPFRHLGYDIFRFKKQNISVTV